MLSNNTLRLTQIKDFPVQGLMLFFVRALVSEAVACFPRAQEAARALYKQTTATKDMTIFEGTRDICY